MIPVLLGAFKKKHDQISPGKNSIDVFSETFGVFLLWQQFLYNDPLPGTQNIQNIIKIKQRLSIE